MSDPAALLTAVVFLPSLGALVLTLFPSDDHTNLKATAIGISLVDFALALLLWTGFDPSRSGYQFAADLPWISQLGIGYRIGIDGISLVFILLTAFIMPITLVGAWSSITTRVKEFGVAMLVLRPACWGPSSRSTSSCSTSSGRRCSCRCTSSSGCGAGSGGSTRR
jgi:NADH-quinone oxidoreductase subunit M